MSKTLSLIIPVYFNADSLSPLFEQIAEMERGLAVCDVSLELIFVDDGSKDRSFDELLAIKRQRPQTKLIKLTRNFGAVASSWSGFSYATGDCIASIPADLQDPPQQILPMVEAWQQGHTLVFSYRRTRQDPWFARLQAACFYRFLNELVTKDYPPGGADMILMDRSLLPYVLGLGRGVNYSIYLVWLGFKAKLLPYDRQARRHGKSRWVFRKKFFYFIDTMTGFSNTPLRLLSGAGLGASLLSLLYGVALVSALGLHTPANTILLVLLVFLMGVMITMLSLAGEYLWRIFELASRHPKSVVGETYLEPVAPLLSSEMAQVP